MIYELRDLHREAGTPVGVMVKAAGTVGACESVRSNYGKLEGYWYDRDRSPQSGHALWSMEKNYFEERPRFAAGAPRQNHRRWTAEYIPLIRRRLAGARNPPAATRVRRQARSPRAPATSTSYANYRAKAAGPSGSGSMHSAVLAGAREIIPRSFGFVADRGRPAQRSLPHLGLSRPHSSRRSTTPMPRRTPEWQGIPRQRPRADTRKRLDHQTARACTRP